MASTWTTTQPTGSSKIRLLPTLLQDRWTNIQDGEVPCKKWRLAVQGSNPATNTGTGQLFTKTSSAGDIELFYKDDTSHVARITTSGGIGELTQKLYGNNVTMKPGATEINNPQQAFCCAFSFFSGQNSNATYPPDAGSFNITSYTRTSTGRYTINLSFTATSALTYVPCLTMRKLSSSQIWQINIVSQNATSFGVRITENGSLSDGDFCAAIFGAFT